eukprot:11096266-Lingulodinium_polyedra.AAC.1
MPIVRLHQCSCLLTWTSTQSETNDVDEEMGRLQPNGTQGPRSGQVEMQSICEFMDQSLSINQSINE